LHFGFDFNLVFYDLTTLYFESFKTDEVRKIGFSKDNKSSNPQVMIGLLVNSDGFPISYQIFPGNKFEGHTLLPSILDLKKKYKINNLTLVADSAMLSDDNINLLETNQFGYIVASRTANLKIELIQEISKKLKQQDKATIRIATKNKGTLICNFCKKRYNKEKIELEKQIEKANYYLKNPNSVEIIKRAKFLKNSNSKFELNQPLIIKYKLLLGIKGYHTNRADQLTDNEIINHYKNLWQVEKAFRISKTDLKIRPIYHHEECTIKAHLVICFTALAISKYIEIKTKKSIKSVIKTLKSSINSVIINKSTNQQIILESEISDDIKKILQQLNTNLSY
jgi:transposase